MERLKVGDLRDELFSKAFTALLNEPALTVGERWPLAETAYCMDAERKKAQKMVDAVILKYLEFVTDEKAKKMKGVAASLLPDGKREEFVRDMEGVDGRAVEIPLKRLVELPKKHGLTPMTLYALAGKIVKAPFAIEEEPDDEDTKPDE